MKKCLHRLQDVVIFATIVFVNNPREIFPEFSAKSLPPILFTHNLFSFRSSKGLSVIPENLPTCAAFKVLSSVTLLLYLYAVRWHRPAGLLIVQPGDKLNQTISQQ